MIIDLSPLVDQILIPALGSVLTGAVVWVANRAVKFLHVQITVIQAQQMEAAINNGIKFALGKVEWVADQHTSIEAKSEVVAIAAKYIVPKVPELLKGLGITQTGLEQRIEARLGNHITPTAAPIPGADQPIY